MIYTCEMVRGDFQLFLDNNPLSNILMINTDTKEIQRYALDDLGNLIIDDNYHAETETVKLPGVMRAEIRNAGDVSRDLIQKMVREYNN
jgi:hypothetical protein